MIKRYQKEDHRSRQRIATAATSLSLSRKGFSADRAIRDRVIDRLPSLARLEKWLYSGGAPATTPRTGVCDGVLAVDRFSSTGHGGSAAPPLPVSVAPVLLAPVPARSVP